MVTGRYQHTATLLPSGKVLVVGGYNSTIPTAYLTSAEIYDPSANTWSTTGSMATARRYHASTLLPNGKVLVTGGQTTTGDPTATAEVYDPATGLWTNANSFITARSSHTASLLPDGRVLIASGETAELYDPGLGFSTTSRPQISSASFDGSARLLLAGTGFRGTSSASGGNGVQDSPTDYPVLQMRRLDNEQMDFIPADAASLFSAVAFTSAPASPFSGCCYATVIANGIPSVASVLFFPAPDIGVFQPVNTGIADGGTQNFGAVFVPGAPAGLNFTIKNPGTANLTGLAISKDGPNAGDFTVTASPTEPVPPGATTTFTVAFTSATSGAKSAAIHIASNVAVKNPYDISLTGQAYSFTQDTDADGLNDASEHQMAALGFDWQVSQTALVDTLFDNANGAGLYTASQMQALNIGAPLLQRNPSTDTFTLTIGVEKSTDLTTFSAFPMTAPQILINGQGKLEFQFSVPDAAAFFRLQSQ